MVAAEIMSGLGGLKTAFDLAKGLKDIDDTVRRNAAVMELQEKILTAQQAQAALVERLRELEKQVASFEQWDIEKEKYELKEIYRQTLAYVIKENARGTEPSHSICAACYQMRRKSILQKSDAVHMTCPECETQYQYKDIAYIA
jgi:mannose/cellobiose epimerase-like protein (N-acyl-D-glucosamine 2-epimerase family)